MEKKYSYGRGNFKTIEEGNEISWLLTNGIGGYASSTICGGSNSAFNSYLTASFNPPVERYVLLSRTQEYVSLKDRSYDLTSQTYVNYNKNGQEYLQKFIFDDVPEYYYGVEDINIKKTIALEHEKNTVVICYEISNGSEEMTFSILPLFNYRPIGLTSDKSQMNFKTNINNKILSVYPSKDKVINFYTSEGTYSDRRELPVTMATPNYLVDEDNYNIIDNRTGSLSLDNHFTPYEIKIKVKPFENKKVYVKCSTDEIDNKDGFKIIKDHKKRMNDLVNIAGYEDNFINNLVKSADNFIVKRNSTGLKTILAGYPWFTDWGRDTMIAFEGLTLVTNRINDAKEILLSFAKYIKNGLVPNVFPDKGTDPMYNTVDASLWYFQAVYKYLVYTGEDEDFKFIYDNIYPKLVEIIESYMKGTDFSIKMDEDYLISAGDGLDQVTWMDVRVGDLVVTPRHGKPVEINALWYNALWIMRILAERYNDTRIDYKSLSDKVKESFNSKFWNENKKCLYDVVDTNDDKIRPNQIFAVSLPFSVLDEYKEKQIVNNVYKYLYSTYGLRSLSFKEEGYHKKYIGKLIDRDKAYHTGTTWAYLFGPFISAYCKVNNYSKEAIKKAEYMCKLFEDHLKDGCINGIAEIFDGNFSSVSRGCFTQAWSVAEVLRAYARDVKPFEE